MKWNLKRISLPRPYTASATPKAIFPAHIVREFTPNSDRFFQIACSIAMFMNYRSGSRHGGQGERMSAKAVPPRRTGSAYGVGPASRLSALRRLSASLFRHGDRCLLRVVRIEC